MQIARRTLYLGVFLITFGAVWLLARGQETQAWVTGLLGLWPVVVIALGVGLLLRRTRLALAGGILAAAVPGLLLGGIVAAAPSMAVHCGVPSGAETRVAEGTFGASAVIDLELDCGTATVTTAPGTGWTVRSIDGSHAPVVRSTDSTLTVRSLGQDGFRFGWAPDGDWSATLPTDTVLDLTASVNAGSARFDLGGAHLGRAAFDVNAAKASIDLATARIERLAVDVNAGKADITLAASSDATVDVTVDAGEARICLPAGLGVRVVQSGELSSFRPNGLVRVGDAWETPGFTTAAHRALVNLTVNVGSVDIAPEGACK